MLRCTCYSGCCTCEASAPAPAHEVDRWKQFGLAQAWATTARADHERDWGLGDDERMTRRVCWTRVELAECVLDEMDEDVTEYNHDAEWKAAFDLWVDFAWVVYCLAYGPQEGFDFRGRLHATFCANPKEVPLS